MFKQNILLLIWFGWTYAYAYAYACMCICYECTEYTSPFIHFNIHDDRNKVTHTLSVISDFHAPIHYIFEWCMYVYVRFIHYIIFERIKHPKKEEKKIDSKRLIDVTNKNEHENLTIFRAKWRLNERESV